MIISSTTAVSTTCLTKEEQIRIEQDKKRTHCIEQSKKGFEILDPIIKGIIVIDSNIWMNQDNDGFFTCLLVICKRKKIKIKLLQAQLDEITAIKNKYDYGHPKNAAARLAFNRFDEFQGQDMLTLIDMRGKHADDLIEEYLTMMSRRGNECMLLTEDIELRVRCKFALIKSAEADYEVSGVKEWISHFDLIAEGYKLENCKDW
jgi:hypothetical protein